MEFSGARMPSAAGRSAPQCAEESTAAFVRAAPFRIARKGRAPHKACMFAIGGDAFPNDTQGLRAALTRGAVPLGAGEDAVTVEGDFPSVEMLRMDLTGVRIDARTPFATAAKDDAGGFFSRSLDVIAKPARIASVPADMSLHAEDCVFTFGTAADGTRTASLQSCTHGTLEASAATAEIERALLALAHAAAAGHGASVESVRLTLETESVRAITVTAVAVAKAMFLTATLTIRGRIAMDDDFNLRLSGTACTGDGMLANLAAAQLRPRLTELEGRTFSLRTILPAGLPPVNVTLAGGASLRVCATFGGK